MCCNDYNITLYIITYQQGFNVPYNGNNYNISISISITSSLLTSETCVRIFSFDLDSYT